MGERDKQAGDDRAGSSLELANIRISGVSLEKLEGRIEEIRAEIVKVENSLENPSELALSESRVGMKNLQKNLNNLYTVVSNTKAAHNSVMKKIESGMNISIKTALAALKKQNVSAGSVKFSEEKSEGEVFYAKPLEEGNDGIFGRITDVMEKNVECPKCHQNTLKTVGGLMAKCTNTSCNYKTIGHL